MASIIRSTLFTTSRLARPTPTQVVAPFSIANFASSSRIGLDFTTPRRLPPSTTTTTTTTTLVEDVLVDEPVSSEAEQVIPSIPISDRVQTTPQSQSPPPASTLTQTPPSLRTSPRTAQYTPQFNLSSSSASSASASSSSSSSLRWTPESTNVGTGEAPHLLPTHTLNIKSTRNNIVLSLTDGLGPLFGTISGGSDKTFKNSQRSSYEAATQAAIKTFDRVVEWSRSTPSRPRVRVAFNGLFGVGREAISSALAGPEGTEMRSLIVRVEDRTKVKIGGVRAPKPRRL
ncbi:hypothetical protein IAR55_003942 [Kwoniella newhampshirensis]|uniref:Ribosomal protein S11 n=1 Tax=Kwoniella newhampshirensis TaxID=1651941 RepID=A0AAW0YW32_9TREE